FSVADYFIPSPSSTVKSIRSRGVKFFGFIPESARLEKEEGAAKARIDALQQQVQCAQEALFQNQRKVRELDMHLEAYKSLQYSQNELLESLEEKRNALTVDCESKQKVLDKLTAEMEEVKELAFVPEAYADLIESLRTCRLSTTGEDQSAFDAETKHYVMVALAASKLPY
ncbi:hypothetical protein Tcan_02947, partial [Toxocara canis]